MAVRLRSQRVVPVVVGQIQRTLLCAQKQGVRKHLPTRTPRSAKHFLKRRWVAGHQSIDTHLAQQSELLQLRYAFLEVLRRGTFVHAICRRNIRVAQHPCHALVCQKHGLLHQRRGPRPTAHHDVRRASLLVQSHLGLRRQEVHGSPSLAHLQAQLRNVVKKLQHAPELGRHGPVVALRRPPAIQIRVHLAVSQTRPRSNGAEKCLGRTHLPSRIQPHAHRDGESVFVGPKRANVVAQALRQHRQHPIDQIDRTGPPLRLKVH